MEPIELIDELIRVHKQYDPNKLVKVEDIIKYLYKVRDNLDESKSR